MIADITIEPVDKSLKLKIQHKLDNKAKPVGSLGKFEDLALQIALIQNTLSPKLNKPIMLTVAADHGITEEDVSPCPVEITWQQVNNFLNGGGGIGLFSQVYAMDLWVADAGVNYDFQAHPKLIDAKVAYGTKNFANQPAMSLSECEQAFTNGRNIVEKFHQTGTNVIGFGEMGIGNTTPASALLSIITKRPVEECVGPGAGLNPGGIAHKAAVIKKAIEKHGVADSVMENMACFGGFEIVTLAGAMVQAAKRKMLLIIDGFITSSALLAVHAMFPNISDYCVFSHQSNEQGHQFMLEHLKAEALLHLNLRLGEGTGSAVAYSILKGAVAVLNDMTSFEEAQVHNTSHIDNIPKAELNYK